MTYAIVTKKIPATNNKGARMRASYLDRSKSYAYDFALDLLNNHRQAATAFAQDFLNLGDSEVTHAVLPYGEQVFIFEDKSTARAEHAQNVKLAHSAMQRWAQVLGLGFHPDTRGADYEPPLTAAEAKQYDLDMLFCQLVLQDPYAAGLRAMKEAGLLDAA